jgi:hypothetical protein
MSNFLILEFYQITKISTHGKFYLEISNTIKVQYLHLAILKGICLKIPPYQAKLT